MGKDWISKRKGGGMTETNGQRKQTLRDWREEFGLEQQELAELCGCPQPNISAVENGVRGPGGPTARKAAEALGIELSQLLPGKPLRQVEIDTSWWEDGFSPTAPRETLRWWREKRCLTPAQLSILSGMRSTHLYKIENNQLKRVTLSTRRRLTTALKVAPDKLILPGDTATPSQKQRVEDTFREDLRAARRALRIAFDFMREDYKIASRYLEERDKALEVVMREMRGT